MDVPNCEAVRHATLFLTGAVPLPEGYGIGAYFAFAPSSPDVPPQFDYLGAISAIKPSATFKVHWALEASAEVAGQFGLAFEPLPELEALQAQRTTQVTPMQSAVLDRVGKTVVDDLSNFLASYSFEIPPTADRPEPLRAVPEQALNNWVAAFDRRLRFNRRFWERTEE
jgi:hypothetical protein